MKNTAALPGEGGVGIVVPGFLAESLAALGGPVVAVQLEGADSDDAESFTFYGVLRREGDPCLVEFPQVRHWIRDDPAPIDAQVEYALRASQGGAEGRCWFARGRVALGSQCGSDKQKTLDG